MIFDRIENISTYMGIDANLDCAIREIMTEENSEWKPGRYIIDGENVFCNTVEITYQDKPCWERHERYLDIHINIDGSERIRCADCLEIEHWGNFNEESDCATAPYSAKGTEIALKKGSFLIAFPQDAHMPGIGKTGLCERKKIYKVRMISQR